VKNKCWKDAILAAEVIAYAFVGVSLSDTIFMGGEYLKGTYHAFKSFIFTYKSYRCGLYKT